MVNIRYLKKIDQMNMQVNLKYISRLVLMNFVIPCHRLLLKDSSRIQIYEGAPRSEVDESSHNAAKAIQNLVGKLTEKDLLIVLCSGQQEHGHFVFFTT